MWRRARRGLGLLGTRHVSRRYDSTHGTHHTLPPVLAAAFFVSAAAFCTFFCTVLVLRGLSSAAAFCTFFCTVLVLRGLSLRGVTRGTVFLTLKSGALKMVGGLRWRGEERSPAAEAASCFSMVVTGSTVGHEVFNGCIAVGLENFGSGALGMTALIAASAWLCCVLSRRSDEM